MHVRMVIPSKILNGAQIKLQVRWFLLLIGIVKKYLITIYLNKRG